VINIQSPEAQKYSSIGILKCKLGHEKMETLAFVWFLAVLSAQLPTAN
jgi:hypothetical protein